MFGSYVIIVSAEICVGALVSGHYLQDISFTTSHDSGNAYRHFIKGWAAAGVGGVSIRPTGGWVGRAWVGGGGQYKAKRG